LIVVECKTEFLRLTETKHTEFLLRFSVQKYILK